MSDEHRDTGNKSNKSFDLRVVELSKASRENPLCKKLKEADNNSYVCLGHFDFLRISHLPGDEPLKRVEEDFKTRDNYNYPLYILHDSTENPEALTSFWNTKFCFMTVSRIHFIPTAEKGAERIWEALKSLGDPIPSGKRAGELSIKVKEEPVHCVFYRTLELSDLVVVLKSDSILSCLHAIRRMMEVAVVGNVYSFCGVHGKLCDPQIDEAIARWDMTCSRQSAKKAMEEVIPYASMRFSVIATRNAKLFWEQAKRSVYFVSGTADAIINFSGASMKDLVRYIAYLSTQEISINSSCSISIHDAFGDIITRIGVPYGDPYELALEPGRREPIPALKTAQKNLKTAVNALPARNARWYPVLAAQIDSLITMMGNCITDDLSILIWPSVKALIDRLSYLFAQSSKIGRKQESEISEFLNCWDILENDVSRMEGELSQKPELLSSRYYIPATLLAFYMSLLHKYNEFLLAANGETGQSYIPLITYNVEPRASTHCILDPSTDDPNKEVYQKVTPLLVSLPVSMLYSPLETVIVLCHEMSHYTGTFTRYREIRFERILSSCANLIAAEWKLDGRSDYPLLKKGYVGIPKVLRQKLKALYPEVSGNAQNAQYYIMDLDKNLYQMITQVFYDEELQTSLLQNFLDEKLKPRYILKYAKAFNASTRNQSLRDIRKHVRTLLILYKECYADLAAVMALNLSAEEYLLNIFHREAKYIKEVSSNEEKERLWEIQVQAALVLHTLEKPFSTDLKSLSCTEEQQEWLKEWKSEINRYRNIFLTKKDISNHSQTGTAMLSGEYLPLLHYLEDCKKALENGLQKEDVQKKQEELKKMLNMVKDYFDLEAIHQAITDYQGTFLETSGSQEQ